MWRHGGTTEDQRPCLSGEQRHIELLHRNLRQFGTVYNTLAAVCDVHGRIVPIARSADQARD